MQDQVLGRAIPRVGLWNVHDLSDNGYFPGMSAYSATPSDQVNGLYPLGSIVENSRPQSYEVIEPLELTFC